MPESSTDNKNILQCHTAKFKLKEAKFFLTQIQKQENWTNEDNITFLINAFVISSSSVIDYIHSDFIFIKIKDPRIKWREWEDKSKRKTIISSHPQSKVIEKFLGYFSNNRKKLLDDPLVNYFVYKRNKIIHVGWDASKMESFTEHPDGKKEIHIRNFEASYRLFMLDKNPDYNLELFYDEIPKSVQINTLARLCEEPLENIGREYLEKLEDFIAKFDGRDFFKNL